jgi:hypothetical protein
MGFPIGLPFIQWLHDLHGSDALKNIPLYVAATSPELELEVKKYDIAGFITEPMDLDQVIDKLRERFTPS